ncbi:ricin-type beta-trefoil lectin domain protein [Phormidium sp. FACHB-592]|uniref:Ricin-type beta-trefoil lectin domain protein n=1 Tax=Stenomitos frigidus AS-A4 TaxID=2933935 RepID=A0ABV0KR19_9CYAN|nr:ricin-type beta-trefoil lectin domain protein [Phormidium sp. FACHB-592]MBD2075884.1 ricin-type beta-trefoil lectin domain protein [Phormidium sp. FACHB-592]
MTTQSNFSTYTAASIGLLTVFMAIGTSAQPVKAETFSVDSVAGSMALNTNNQFRKIDGQPRVAVWQRNDNDPDQQFDRLPGKAGSTLLKQRSTGKCLNAHYLRNGAELNVWNCNASDPDQNFTITDWGGNYNQIKRTGTNLCVDSPTRANGGKVHLWECNSSYSNQRWKSSNQVIGNIDLPFKVGQTWYVCQGYSGPISHTGYPALDLTVAQDFGRNNSCWAANGNVSKSASQVVLAPADGTISYVNTDLVCLSIDDKRSLLIGHMNRSVARGQRVSRGTVLGTVSRANGANGGYSHIHLEARKSKNCQRGTAVPFTAKDGFQFRGVGDLPLGQTYWKRALTRR